MQSIHRPTYPRAMAVAALSLVLMFAIATPAFGASIPLSIDRMTDEARVVVLADCVSTVSRAVEPALGYCH